MKTKKEITSEVVALKKMKPNVRRMSVFGDDHHNAIDAQIEVLENNMSDGDIYDNFEPFNEETDADDGRAENVLYAARQAYQWMHDEIEESPSEEWVSLT